MALSKKEKKQGYTWLIAAFGTIFIGYPMLNIPISIPTSLFAIFLAYYFNKVK